MQNKKILFVISSLKSGGGAEKVCATIATKLYELGYDVHYLTFYDYENKYEFKGKYNCLNEKFAWNVFWNIKKLFSRAKATAKYCKENNIDIIISFMEEANFPNIFSKIIFWNKAKINVSIRQSVNAWWRLYKFLIKRTYSFSDNIITIVKEEKENLIKNYWIKEEKIKVIYNPIDLEKIQNLSKEDLGKHKELFNNLKFTFINVWRLTKQKKQEQLIKVFKKFNEKYPETQLVILGEGELRKQLEEEIWNNKNIHLFWLQKNPYKFLVNSDCFVFSSKWEWMPGAVLEALACSLPIISTDCSTWPAEILRKNSDFSKVDNVSLEDFGILYPEWNEEKLFEAMEKIYLDKNLQEELKKKSLQRAKDFEVNNILEKWGQIL